MRYSQHSCGFEVGHDGSCLRQRYARRRHQQAGIAEDRAGLDWLATNRTRGAERGQAAVGERVGRKVDTVGSTRGVMRQRQDQHRQRIGKRDDKSGRRV